MRKILPWMVLCLIVGFVPGTAFAEEAPAAAAVKADDAAKPADADKPADGAKPDEKSFPWFSLSPTVGYAYFGKGDLSIGGNTFTIESRSGARIALQLAMGGDGFAFELSPLFIHESGTGFTSNTVGLFTGFLWRLQFGRWYPHFGAGLQAGYMMSDNLDLGFELYGRVPLGVTWYVLKNLGVVAELGVGYGASGMKLKSNPAIPKPELKFAPDVMIDFSVGIRWP